MILTFILLLFANLWAIAFSILPTGTLPAGVTSGITTVLSWLYVANPVVDIPTMVSLFVTALGIELAILGVEFFFWVYAKLPVIGKR